MTQHNSYGNDTRGDDPIISREDRDAFASDAFKKTGDAFSKAEIGKTKKYLGLFEMDAGIADGLDGLYNIGADWFSHKLRPHIFRIVETYAPKVGLGKQAKTLAAAATIGSTFGVKTAGYFSTIYDGFKTQWKEQNNLVHKIAPVLDDIKGSHSLAALYTVGQNDNEVIYAHRKRLGKIADAKHFSNFVELGIKSGSSLIFDLQGMSSLVRDRNTITWQEVNQRLAPALKEGEHASHESSPDSFEGKQAIKMGVIGLLPQLAGRISATNQYKLHKELQPYSALEMITELTDQISSNPKARGFTVPKSFQSAKAHREEYPLEEYLMRICIQHQKEMSDLSSDHTEIREALRDDLMAAVKPLADALRKGDMSTMSLIRLVGEGKIIKKHGRAIASAEEVKDLVEREAPKHLSYTSVSPAEYFKDAVFSRGQLTQALNALKGEDKAQFASLFHDSILSEAGMSKDEIKHIRESTVRNYDSRLCELVLGLNARNDNELKTDGMAHGEIEHLRKAAKSIQDRGEEAAHELKTGPANDNGIEHLLANAIVPHVVQQPQYMGKIASAGHEQLADVAANDDESYKGRENARRLAGAGTEAYLD